MGTHWPKPGLNSVAEYQASGYALPLEGSSDIRLLQFVASEIAFTQAGTFIVYDTGSNPSSTLTISGPCTVKAKFLTFKSSGDCIVTLTNIPSASYAAPLFSEMTGS